MCCYWEDDGRGFRQLLLVMPPSKVCPECDAVVPIRLKVCKSCQHVFRAKQKTELTVITLAPTVLHFSAFILAFD